MIYLYLLAFAAVMSALAAFAAAYRAIPCGDNVPNTNSTVDKRERREHLRCPICPPNKGENTNRKPKHGSRKPKKKDHK